MSGWTTKHRNLVALVGLVLVAFVAAYSFIIRPKQQEVTRLEQSMQTLQAELLKSGWPLDAGRLNSLKDLKYKERDQLRKFADKQLERATTVFLKKIEDPRYGGPEDFRSNVSRLDYTEEFNLLEQTFRAPKHPIILAPEVLHLSEKTDSPNTYQLLIQLWTLQAVTDLALAAKLTPAPSNVLVEVEIGSKRLNVPAARLSVLPVRAYTLRPEDREPFLLEFPVRLGLRGKLENLCLFLAAVQTDKNFFPVAHLEVRKTFPGEDQTVDDEIEIDVECSSFLRFKDNGTVPVNLGTEKNIPVLPPGA